MDRQSAALYRTLAKGRPLRAQGKILTQISKATTISLFHRPIYALKRRDEN